MLLTTIIILLTNLKRLEYTGIIINTTDFIAISNAFGLDRELVVFFLINSI